MSIAATPPLQTRRVWALLGAAALATAAGVAVATYPIVAFGLAALVLALAFALRDLTTTERMMAIVLLGGAMMLGNGFANIGVSAGPVPIPATEILFIPLALIALADRRTRLDSRVLLPASLFGLLVLIRLVFDFPVWGIFAVRDTTLALEVFILLVGYRAVARDGIAYWLPRMKWIFLAVVLYGLLTPFQDQLRPLVTVGLQRPVSLFDMAGVKHAVVAASFFYFIFGRGWVRLAVLGVVAGMLGIFQARTLYVLFPLGLLLIGWITRRFTQTIALLIPIILLGLGFILYVGSAGIEGRRGEVTTDFIEAHARTLLGEDGPADGTIDARVSWFDATVAEVTKSPGTVAVGVGLGPDLTFGFLGKEDQAVRKPHDDYLEVWARTGTLGLIIFLWLLWVCVAPVVRKALSGTGVEERFCAWIVGLCLIYLGGAAVQPALSFPYASVPVFFTLGMGLYLSKQPGRRAVPAASRPGPRLQLVEAKPEGRETRLLDAPLVGRGAEVAALRADFESATRERNCRLVTVVGEPGIGKSRLVTEFATSLDAQVLHARCLPPGEGPSFWPLGEIIVQAAGITDDDDADLATKKIASVLRGHDDAVATSQSVAAAIGMSPITFAGSFSGRERSDAVRRFLGALAAQRPLAIVVEDVQWAQTSFLELVKELVGSTPGAPILVMCAARPGFLDAQQDWPRAGDATRVVALGELDHDDVNALIEELLDDSGLPGAARSMVAARAAGNPLFLEQTLLLWIDDGVLTKDDGNWLLAADAPIGAVPTTLSALLTARLERLRRVERLVLEGASVVGPVFHPAAVQQLCPGNLAPRLPAIFRGLMSKGLIRGCAGNAAEEQAFEFSHALIRDVVYTSVLKRNRAELHERFADWLDKSGRDAAHQHEEIIGYHLERAYRYRADLGPVSDVEHHIARKAARKLGSAGKRALARGDMPSAAALLGRALELTDLKDPQRLELLHDHCSSLANNLSLGEGTREQSDEEALIQANARARERIQRLTTLGFTDDSAEWRRSALREAESAIPSFQQAHDEIGLVHAYWLISDVYVLELRFGAAQVITEKALEHARRSGDRIQESRCLQRLAGLVFWGPTPVEQALRSCREIVDALAGKRDAEAGCLFRMAGLQAMRGDFDEARKLMTEGKSILGHLGLVTSLAGNAQICGSVEMLAGDPAGAERELRAGLDVFDRAGDVANAGSLAAQLADALFTQGRHEQAEHFCRIAESSLGEDGVAAWGLTRARLLASVGRADEADRMAHRAVAATATGDNLNAHGDVLVRLAEVFSLTGQDDQRRAALQEAAGLYEQKGNTVAARRALLLLQGAAPVA
ncbi:MAG: AAA family ATPase [Actinomycetota bacterium]